MRIAVVGSGYVGLVTAACLADAGNHVLGVDLDAAKVARLNEGRSPIFEPGLEEILRANLAAGRLKFTTDIAAGVANAQVIFIAVGTPVGPDGAPDLQFIDAAARQIGSCLTAPAVIVIKSTIPVGTTERVRGLVASATRQPFDMVHNPEFLKEGAAVDDFLRPDRVVIGAESATAADLIAELHAPFVRNNKPILRMSVRAAEMTKYAANCYLATRISYINEIAALCEKLGVDVDQVRRGIGTDARIGSHFLYPGLGYGGSCFPKDVQALIHTARAAGEESPICQAVHRRNELQRVALAEKVITRFGRDLGGRRFAVWGLAFKPKTDDVREAPALSVIERLLAAGAAIAVHDPRAIESARRVLAARVQYHADAYEALPGADALLVCTEWMEYRSPDFDLIRQHLRQPLIFDGRNVFALDTMTRLGFEYHSIGRPPVAAGGGR
jgi:UDPglucose 6-dehydrogenase